MQKILPSKNQNPLFHKIDQFCDEHNILNKRDIIIFACSGGSDSVFLAHYLFCRAKLIGFSVVLAYFDHEWRKEAKDEIIFCRNVAEKLSFEFVTSSASVFKEKVTYNGSKEEMAREMRYAFFYEILKEKNAQYIVLAHHLDDQIETFFIRLLRGTSLAGLCGMKVKNNALLRPLLEVTKKEMIEWLEKNNISWCHDQTNDSDIFLRNNIRNNVIPALKLCDDRFVKNIEKLMKRLQKTSDYIQSMTEKIYKQISFVEDNVQYLCINELLKEEAEMQYRILLRFLIDYRVQFNESENFLQEILRFLENKAKKHQCTKEWEMVKINIACPGCNKKERSIFICIQKALKN